MPYWVVEGSVQCISSVKPYFHYGCALRCVASDSQR